MGRSRARGLTLVECAAVCAVSAVLAAVALPSLRGHELRAGRWDAVQALTRLQAAQEQHRGAHGFYAHDLSALQGVGPRSAQGRYSVTLIRSDAVAYQASAVAEGVQQQDTGCRSLTLSVASGFATSGPAPQCWNR